MSCIKCDEFQDSGAKIYYRFKNANMEINGCREHVLEIFDILNRAQLKEKGTQRYKKMKDDIIEMVDSAFKGEELLWGEWEQVKKEFMLRYE